MEEKMEISKEIIVEEIRKVEERYRKIEELFTKNPIPECKQIKVTIEGLKQIPYHIKYPNLKSIYPWLGQNSYFAQTIYIFSVTNFPYSKEEMEEKFKEISSKSSNKKFSLCRINADSPEWKNVKKNKAVCLYVGSSDGLQHRLKDHLCSCNPNTYAMHLEAWFEPDLPITINTWGLYEFLDEDPSGYLQNIEDFLWNYYKPLLGKQGKK
jgi:hypothetical protein